MSMFGSQPATDERDSLADLEHMVRTSKCAWGVAVDAVGRVVITAPAALDLRNAARLANAILAACADGKNGSDMPR